MVVELVFPLVVLYVIMNAAFRSSFMQIAELPPTGYLHDPSVGAGVVGAAVVDAGVVLGTGVVLEAVVVFGEVVVVLGVTVVVVAVVGATVVVVLDDF
jgi:hypothetical protein